MSLAMKLLMSVEVIPYETNVSISSNVSFSNKADTGLWKSWPYLLGAAYDGVGTWCQADEAAAAVWRRDHTAHMGVRESADHTTSAPYQSKSIVT